MSVPGKFLEEAEVRKLMGDEWTAKFCEIWDLPDGMVVGNISLKKGGYALRNVRSKAKDALHYPINGYTRRSLLEDNGLNICESIGSIVASRLDLETRGFSLGDLVLGEIISSAPKQKVLSIATSLQIRPTSLRKLQLVRFRSGEEFLCDLEGIVVSEVDITQTLRIKTDSLKQVLADTKYGIENEYMEMERQQLIKSIIRTLNLRVMQINEESQLKKLHGIWTLTAEAEDYQAGIRAQIEAAQKTIKNSEPIITRLKKLGVYVEDGLLVGQKSLTETTSRQTFGMPLEGPGWQRLIHYIQAWIYNRKQEIYYPEYLLADFLTLIRTGDFFILSGEPGCGKSQMVRCFAEAIGAKHKVIPVLPSWNSKDELLGYFNPIQNSFVSAPFLEALVDAKNDPDTLFLICLDEMNLARVENYFAYFLSLLEDRNGTDKVEVLHRTEVEALHTELSGYGFLGNNRHFDGNARADADFDRLSEDQKARLRRGLVAWPYVQPFRFPANVRVIGTVNFDETTQPFSPKFLDRTYVIRFPNPLDGSNLPSETTREELTNWKGEEYSLRYEEIVPPAKNELGISDASLMMQNFLSLSLNQFSKLGAAVSARSYRQSLRYVQLFTELGSPYDESLALNQILLHKVIPRMHFEWDDTKEKIMDGILNKKNGSLRKILPEGSLSVPEVQEAIQRFRDLMETAKVSHFFNGME